MAGKKRKLDLKSIEIKYQVIKAVEDGKKKKGEIAKEFNIPSSTLSTWIKNKEGIKEAFESASFGPSTKRMRTALYPDVEKALDLWFRDARAAATPISGPILMARADELAQQLGHSEFSANTGWLQRFNKRHGYVYRSICGEARSVNQEHVQQWKDGPLAHILSTYSPDDIFNADETGLFYIMEPSSSFMLKGETCTGGKRSKERVTVLPCANMSGTEKLPLLVIGKFAKPRCFTGMNMACLPTQYKAQKRAWMDGELFTAWLKKLDAKMTIRKRNIAVIIDNCRAHPHVQGLKSVKLVFLPPNTTSCTQPMDQGIIQNLKVFYRHLLVKRGLLPAVEQKITMQWTMLDTLSALKDAWTKVKPATIANCFRHCGFVKPDAPPPQLMMMMMIQKMTFLLQY